MKKTLIIVLFLITAACPQNMRKNAYYSLFADQKAGQIGDAITIIVVESSLASNNAEKNTGKSSDLGLGVSGSVSGTDIPNVDAKIGTNNEFNGNGSTKTTGVIQTKISATIDSVLSNGNLVISGNKKLNINGEEQIISIKGVVRTTDVRPDNSVLSYNISNAEISFEGNGLIQDSQSPGWLTKFLHWIF
ncbi:MAG: flagellar basal body L-ring protein FlgH [Ignavibacteriaceae bacterium]|nr:flagellar basal body L-ring protein FlgH [Ignavibacteriaceae bacterium]